MKVCKIKLPRRGRHLTMGAKEFRAKVGLYVLPILLWMGDVGGGIKWVLQTLQIDVSSWFFLCISLISIDRSLTDNICQDSIQTPYKSRNIKKITYLSQKMGYFSENIRLLTKNLSQKVEYDEVEYIYALLFQQCPFSNSQEIV